jgi:hypothetical protein
MSYFYIYLKKSFPETMVIGRNTPRGVREVRYSGGGGEGEGGGAEGGAEGRAGGGAEGRATTRCAAAVVLGGNGSSWSDITR